MTKENKEKVKDNPQEAKEFAKALENVKKNPTNKKVKGKQQDEVKQEPKQQEKKETKRKPYVHIDVYLQTAIPYFGLNSMQATGFKSRMNGRHYQRDEEVFTKELKKYLNL